MNGSYLLDTNVVIALFDREAQVQDRLHSAAEILLSSTVLGELHFGAASSDRPQQNLARLETFAASCTVLATDAETARLFGSIKAMLKKSGRPIPDHDIWIAASARQYGLTLVTRDRHFDEVSGLPTEAW
jgi:tRNA(fMet)-specific endonuclease VapC